MEKFYFAILLGLVTSLGYYQPVEAQKRSNSVKDSSRERIMSRERTVRRRAAARQKSSTRVEFDKAQISGESTMPMIDNLGQKTADKKYGLLPIRYEWHDKLKSSTSSLETSKGR